MMAATKDNAPGQGGVNHAAQQVGLTDASYPSGLATVKSRILADLLDGMRLTHFDGRVRHSTNRTADCIFVLRGEGWPIETTMIEVSAKDGRPSKIAKYSLSETAIRQAGEPGRRFAEAVRAAWRLS